MSNPHPSRLYTVETLAHFLQCSTSFVYKLSARGRIGHVKVGRQLRFTPEQVQDYLVSCTHAGRGSALTSSTARRRRKPLPG